MACCAVSFKRCRCLRSSHIPKCGCRARTLREQWDNLRSRLHSRRTRSQLEPACAAPARREHPRLAEDRRHELAQRRPSRREHTRTPERVRRDAVTRTLHVVALPHTTLTEKDATCAYSMKVLKFVPMMQAQGCRVVLYGPDEIACEPDEHVVITTEDDRLRWGYGGPTGYDTTKPFLWDSAQPYWFEAGHRAIAAMRERVQPRDYLCLVTSTWATIADTIAGPRWNNPITVEWAVGYEGIDPRSHAAFESYAWMHHVYGIRSIVDGRAYDQVIPNF